MKIIVGLGNPGRNYAQTRHNLGFWVLDHLSLRWQIRLGAHKFKAKYGRGNVAGQQVLLIKPQTFMNLSGESVGGFVDFYRLDLARLLIIYDDLDLEPGSLRIKGSGSAGGHRGMASIISRLGSSEFPRLRLGIGAPPEFLDAAEYVLQEIEASQVKFIEDACLRAAQAAEMWLAEGLSATMNCFNRKEV